MSASYEDLPVRSPRFVFAQHAIRMTCECCGYPTLGLVPFTDGTIDWESCVLGCLLCDWESAPARDDGTPDPAAPAPEVRNEGYTLATARANVARFAWMYDPDRPEPWMGGRPSNDELAVRLDLRDAYDRLVAEPGPYLPWDLWDEVLGCEARLRDAEARRARVVQFSADREDA